MSMPRKTALLSIALSLVLLALFVIDQHHHGRWPF